MYIKIKKSGFNVNQLAEEYGSFTNFDEELEDFAYLLRGIVLDRIDRGEFLGGVWKDKLYSYNMIKAFKLGNVSITGEKKNKDMYINGIWIDREDWGWGGYDKSGNFMRNAKGDKIPSSKAVHYQIRESPDDGLVNSGPAPLFIPGYAVWRSKYNGLTSSRPNLSFSGNMLDNFEFDVSKIRGSNAYQKLAKIEIIIDQRFRNISEITDYYRKWIDITEDEIRQAIIESGLPATFKL